MTTLTIRSRRTGEEFNFWMNDGGGYIHLESKGRNGCLGRQICKGGGFTGSTLSANTENQFKERCRKWYRAYQEDTKKYGY